MHAFMSILGSNAISEPALNTNNVTNVTVNIFTLMFIFVKYYI